jgi:phosphoribosylformylglycinamidine (FGAM) synthase PurS component
MKRLSFCFVISLLMIGTLVGCGGSSSSTPTVTPAEIVAADKSALTVSYASGDTSSSVTQNLTLATSGSQGSTITWNSSNPAVISNTGVVSRPITGDAAVTLTATIAMTPASDTKTFPVTVKAQMTDAEAVAAAKAALAIGYASGDSAASVTKNLTLPATGLDNSTIGWASNNAAVITNAGVVNQPPTGNNEVTLTATITMGTASDTKGFLLVVKPQLTDAQAVAAAKAAIAIGYADGDAATTVTQDLALPASGLYGTTVAWSSSDPAIASDGTVSRPLTSDLPVTLTATVSLRAASDTHDFIVTVKAQMTDAQAVAAAKQALQIGYIEGDLSPRRHPKPRLARDRQQRMHHQLGFQRSGHRF